MFYLSSLVSVLRVLVDKLQACHRWAKSIEPIVPNVDFEFHRIRFFALTFVEQIFWQCTLNRFHDAHCQKMGARQVLKAEVQKLATRVQCQRVSILGCSEKMLCLLLRLLSKLLNGFLLSFVLLFSRVSVWHTTNRALCR